MYESWSFLDLIYLICQHCPNWQMEDSVMKTACFVSSPKWTKPHSIKRPSPSPPRQHKSAPTRPVNCILSGWWRKFRSSVPAPQNSGIKRGLWKCLRMPYDILTCIVHCAHMTHCGYTFKRNSPNWLMGCFCPKAHMIALSGIETWMISRSSLCMWYNHHLSRNLDVELGFILMVWFVVCVCVLGGGGDILLFFILNVW